MISFPTFQELNIFIEAKEMPEMFKILFKALIRLPMCVIFWVSVGYFINKLINKKYDVLFSDNGGYPAAELCLSIMIAGKITGINKRLLIINSCPSPRKAPFQLLEWVLDSSVSWASSEIITISQAAADQLKNLRFPGRELKVIYNGIFVRRMDTKSLEEKRKNLGVQAGNEVIGVIGDYEKLKGHESLMRAFLLILEKYPQAKLVFIGSDAYEYSKYLKELALSLHLEGHVIFTGYLNNASEYIECFNMLILPSIAYEGFGMVLLEAMLYQKPVIGTSIGGIPEVLGDAGLIVKPGSCQELARAIDLLLTDPALCKGLINKGFNRLNMMFTASRMANEYFNLTQSC
ncbi:MAG: glycosyltransferase family 4 protein [Candidatus Omnitrophica bacterium]|nr:glycosyltransferase family 4 protein [Candidatus Omnitrophota bacterium]